MSSTSAAIELSAAPARSSSMVEPSTGARSLRGWRCWFFRGENFACYKKGGDFCFAVTGDNRYHAVIGGELCYIVHPSDTSTALLALNASARISGSAGERVVAFDNYFHGPREAVLTENVLKQDEILLEVQVPQPAAGTKMAWTKIKDRQ